ncbi:MAG: ribonuclease III [Myxococcota bacterium]
MTKRSKEDKLVDYKVDDTIPGSGPLYKRRRPEMADGPARGAANTRTRERAVEPFEERGHMGLGDTMSYAIDGDVRSTNSGVSWAQMRRLERRIGYTFVDRELLERAMTHPSYANERRGKQRHNQRMEFLGDAVLGLITATQLYMREEFEDEGMLTRSLSALVCERALAAKAREINLGDYLRLGKGEQGQGGRERDSILCDAYEALMAAVYVDGGFSAARDVVLRLHEQELRSVERPQPRSPNFKGQLQGLIQAKYNVQPTYHIVQEYGPEHCKMFVAEVRVMGERMGQGEGRSKKQAEQNAAQEACGMFQTVGSH